MKVYNLNRVQLLPVSVEAAWAFFSSAKNLSKITPAEMGFVIRTKLNDDPIFEGMKIEYTVKPILNIPMRWVTLIGKVNAPYQFTDSQLKGPYALWEHTHTFEAVPGGVKMTDDVKYAMPMGILGNIAHTVAIRKQLEHIFDFRKKALDTYFGELKQDRP